MSYRCGRNAVSRREVDHGNHKRHEFLQLPEGQQAPPSIFSLSSLAGMF